MAFNLLWWKILDINIRICDSQHIEQNIEINNTITGIINDILCALRPPGGMCLLYLWESSHKGLETVHELVLREYLFSQNAITLDTIRQLGQPLVAIARHPWLQRLLDTVWLAYWNTGLSMFYCVCATRHTGTLAWRHIWCCVDRSLLHHHHTLVSGFHSQSQTNQKTQILKNTMNLIVIPLRQRFRLPWDLHV